MTRDLRDFDLAGAMRDLYESGSYYASIPAGESSYEESYWGEVVDPDGHRRDRTAERDTYLADIATELDYIAALTIDRVLDVGCGLGWLLSALASNCQKFGIEPSAFAAGRAGDHGEVFCGLLLDCQFPAESFDVVVMHHVIEHMTNPEANIRRVWELLKPGARLILGTPDFDSACARRFGSRYRLLNDPTHISLFSNDSMHRFLRDHGFSITMVDYPFFGTRHFTQENLRRLFEIDRVSPPSYGNFMTFYCVRSDDRQF